MHGWVRVALVLCPLVAAACTRSGSELVESSSAPPPPDASIDSASGPPSRLCSSDDLPSCAVGRCAVSGAAGALPAGSRLRVQEAPVPAALSGDALSASLCELTLPEGATELTLTITLDAASTEEATLFRLEAPFARAIEASARSGSRVTAVVSKSGLYGATKRAGTLVIESVFRTDALASSTTAELVRNVTAGTIRAAAFDGTRLFVGSGGRVFIYEGIPTSPSQKPAVVLGAPNLDTVLPGASASILASVNAIWTNGQRLVVADESRVLVWNKIPTVDFTPADLVLGQQDFSTRTANLGGASASTLASPQAIDSDGTRLAVADTMNHRVLVWSTFPSSIGQPASSVLGQSSFSATPIGLLYQPWGVLLDGAGLYAAAQFSGVRHFGATTTGAEPDYAPTPIVAITRVKADGLFGATSIARTGSSGLAMMDPIGSRVAIQRQTAAESRSIDFALGQPDTVRNVAHPVSASSVGSTAKVSAFQDRFFIADQHRLLIYDAPPAYNFEPASRVLGAAGFTTREPSVDYRRTSLRTLAHPADIAAHGNVVAVSDRSNNRVLLFDAASLGAASPEASVVLGQPNGTAFIANADALIPTASTLSGPSGVAIDGSRLVVADTENHRVLIWSPIPSTSNTPANVVLGQADFSGRRPNRGRGDANRDGFCDADADGFFAPTGVALHQNRLFVADRLNHRVLVFQNIGALSNGQGADLVLGQPNATSVTANRGSGPFLPRIDGFNLPSGVSVAGDVLWVADTENNRIVRYEGLATQTPTPVAVLGQADGATLSNPNYFLDTSVNAGSPIVPATTESSVLRPRAIAVSGTKLFVSETGSHRVHIFDAGSGSYVSAGVVGQTATNAGSSNAGGLSASSLAAPLGLAVLGERLFVTDSANHRVLGYPASLASSGSSATTVIGQTSFVANGFNQATATTSDGAPRPRGIAVSNGELFVAESLQHRIVIHELPLTVGKAATRILGQADGASILPNSGGEPSATSLKSPRGVYADAARVMVADAGNNRVLVYPRASAEATLVLGQESFSQGFANRGEGPSAASMSAPEGVFTDGTRVFVADTGNHRVLVWNSFPMAQGQAADIVLGQADASSVAPNRGLGVASESTLARPTAIVTEGSRLFVADSGNSRVLMFDLSTLATGLSAAAVFGQPSADASRPASDPGDTSRLSGPSAIASDGAYLYVAERDVSRVSVFPLDGSDPKPRVISTSAGTPLANPGGLALERMPLFRTRVYVSDTNNARIVVLGGSSRLLASNGAR